MEQLLTYLLKSAALLSIFFAVYQLLLRNDTSFLANRRFLFLGIIASLVLPAVEFTRVVFVESTSVPLNILSTEELPDLPITPEKTLDWWLIAGITYLLGLGFLLIRFLSQLISLLKLLNHGTRSLEDKHILITSKKIVTPFSFFQYIMFNPELHSEEELKIILEHEKVHASQYHSADVLLSNLTAAVLWFNPFSWWYRKSLIQNLEYLADKETVATAIPRKEYQQTLVKISVADFQPALANNFYQSLIKKRIIMLNKKPTRNLSLLKTGAVLPFLIAFMFFFNIKTEAQIKAKEQVSDETFQEETIISTVITKSTQEETLEEIADMFENQGVDLKFDIVEYSDKNLLTKIAISFEKKQSGQTGNVSFNNSEGIGDIRIAMDDNSFTIEPVSSKINTDNIWKKIGVSPLYILDGKTYTTEDLAGKTIWIKGGITAMSTEEAAGKYSENSEDGVIIINGAEILADFKAALKEIDSKGENVVNQYISVLKGESPRLISLESNNSEYIIPPATDIIAYQNDNVRISSKIFITDSVKPMFVVNGEIKADFEQEMIDPDDIATVNIIKGQDAIKKYGEKGKNGVVVIFLKSEEEREAVDQHREKILQEREETFQYEAQKIIIKDDSGKDSSTIKILGVSKADFDAQSNALFVVDGKVMPKDFKPKGIDPETIESINVLKGDSATEKYGEKAAEGAIEINLKKKE